MLSTTQEYLGERLRLKRPPSRCELGRGSVRPYRFYNVMKRALDLTLCLMVMPIVLPVIGICALCIWLEDPGPVFFFQERTGRNGRRFKMFKLRSMVKNAEQKKRELMHLNELAWPDFKITNDPRVLRIGKLLRKTSLDELPQLFNVILGDMSLVGPRPTSFRVDTYKLWQTERLEVLPGITGLWQISGRAQVEFDDRLRMDIEYIRNRSILLDIRLMYQTVFAVLKMRGAK